MAAKMDYSQFKKIVIEILVKKAGVKSSDVYLHHYRHNTLIGIGQKPNVKPVVNINYDTKFLVSINMKFLKGKLAKDDRQQIVQATNSYMRTLWKKVNPPFNYHQGINDDGAIN